MKKTNKTIYNFFLVFIFVMQNKIFSINEIIVHLEMNYDIVLQKETILKYIRTMKYLGFSFRRKNNEVYVLEMTPFCIENSKTEDLLLKCFRILKSFTLSGHLLQSDKFIQKLAPFLSLETKNMLEIEYENLLKLNNESKLNVRKLKKYCNDGLQLRVKIKRENSNISSKIVEPLDLFFLKNICFLKAFDISVKDNVFINIDEIVEIEQTPQRNKYPLIEHPVTLRFLNKLAKSYSLKEGEIITKKSEDELIVKSYYCEKMIFFNNILRYCDSCEIIAPKGLRDEFKNYLDEIYQKYDCPNVN